MRPTAIIIILLVAVSAGASAGSLDVRDFGAKGDGATDDTAAFQRAMDDCANRGGGIVSVPTGRYLIKTRLSIPPSVTLEGNWRAPATVNEYRDPSDPKGGPKLSGSVLLAVEGAGNPDGAPFISLGRNSTLKGVTIFYPEQTKTNPPIAYPWTVASTNDNCSIVDVFIVNPYQAVDFGTRVSGRHYIRGLYAQPLRKGLYVDMCLDVGRIENIHFWPFWTAADADSPVAKFMLEQGEAFIFGRADWEYVTNCFCISYKVGMRFIRGHGTGPYEGGGNYLLTQSGADGCDMAVLVDETQGHSGVSFSNSQIFGDIIVKDTNNGMIRFTGCGLFGTQYEKNGVGLADIAGNGRVSFDNCHFYVIHRDLKKAKNMIRVRSGRVSITDSLFVNYWDAPYSRNPIILEPEVKAAIITNNEFYGTANITNKALGRTVISGNITETDTKPYPLWKKPDRPKEEPGAIVVDDADGPPGVIFVGEWTLVENTYNLNIGYYRGTRWAWKGDGKAQAIFRPLVPKPGSYIVYAYFGFDPASDHATNAPVEIRSADGTQKTTVNLRSTKGEWVRLGTYRFQAGRKGCIILSNNADGNVLADAVKLIPARNAN